MRVMIFVLLSLMWCGFTGADEGMWLPEQLPQIGERLAAAGLETSPGSFANLTDHPMGAIVSLGGCSASFISPDGLVATNHHCALGTIQFNSTAENNLLTDGFLAGSRDQELPAAPGARVLVTVRADDVTDRVLSSIPPDADGTARFTAIEQAKKELIAACEKTAGHRCDVASFFGGSLFRIYDQLEIRDVRLAYAPPSSIGKYGGDVDNWMWPRHTGDFSLYRAWVGPDGQPADPAPENVPFKPEHWLRVATDGVAENDFVMVVGFPGRTNRYRLASEVEHAIETEYPQQVERLTKILEIIDHETEGRPEAMVAYAAMSSYINNVLKKSQGMLAGFARSDSVARKQALETDLVEWIHADADREARWGDALPQLETFLEEHFATGRRDQIFGLLGYLQMWAAPAKGYRLARERELPDSERSPGYQERDMAKTRGFLAMMARNFDAQVDRAILGQVFEDHAALPESVRLEALDQWLGLDGEVDPAKAIASRLETMYAESRLVDPEARLALLDAERSFFEASDDPFVQLAVAMYPTLLKLEADKEAFEGRLLEARPRVMGALLAYQQTTGSEIYPDANGTLRVTFGNVTGYVPRDATVYLPFTTAEGMAAKATGVTPFDAPTRTLEAIAEKDYGPYVSEEIGSLPVNFLSSVDTTGGNSGSATIDADGRLVGLLFDGNWESMISDWDFLPKVTRSIHVDVRYMLWVLDRIDDAGHLLEEIGVAPAFREVPPGPRHQ